MTMFWRTLALYLLWALAAIRVFVIRSVRDETQRGATLAFPGRKSRRQKSTKAIYRLIPTSSFMPGP